MINLTLTPDELLMLLGVKEAQIYQQSKEIEGLVKLNLNLKHENSKLLKDRDMDLIELESLRSRVTRVTMMLGKAS